MADYKDLSQIQRQKQQAQYQQFVQNRRNERDQASATAGERHLRWEYQEAIQRRDAAVRAAQQNGSWTPELTEQFDNFDEVARGCEIQWQNEYAQHPGAAKWEAWVKE